LSLVTLIFDLDIETRPSKGPNTSSPEFGANPLAVPEIFDSQLMTDNSPKTELYLHAVTVLTSGHVTCNYGN